MLFGDRGKALVIRKSMLALKKEEKDWRQTNIFHTCYTIEKKVCKLIITRESCKNIISQETVTKLNLSIEKHP